MIRWLTRFSLKNTAAVLVAALFVTAGGLWSAFQLEQETMPDVSIPIIAVVTPYPGAAPGDVLADITEPVEDSLAGVAGIEHVDSSSMENVSLVIAEYSFSADMEKAQSDIEEAVGRVELPDAAQEPQVSRVSFGSFPVLRVSIANGDVAPAELTRVVEERVVPSLSGLAGVGSISVAGSNADGVHVKLLPDHLADEGVTAQQVQQQIQAAHLSFPVGSVEMGRTVKPVRVDGKFTSVRDLRDLEVPKQPDMAAAIKDAFGSIGEGFDAIGSGMGMLGRGMGDLGAAVGDLGQGLGELGVGMGEMGQGLGTQIGLVNGIADLKNQTIDAKLGLYQAQQTLGDPGATPDQKAEASATAAQLSATIPQLEAATKQLETQLAAMQKQMAAGAGAAGGAPPTSQGGSGGGSGGMPSMSSDGRESDFDTDLETVRLSDVAQVTVGPGSREAFTRADGKPAVLMEIVKSQEANTVDLVDNVKAKLDEIAGKLPEGTRVHYVYDGSIQVRDSVQGLVQDGLIGAALAFLVMFVALRDWRTTLISAISIPTSVLAAMLFLKQAGVTLNVVTLGGMALSTGRVVDDSIVVIENIFRRLQHAEEGSAALIEEATGEVSGAITSSTLTTAAVFVPLAMVSGMVGRVFEPFALTVGLALMASLLVSVTVVPLVAKLTMLEVGVKLRDETKGRMIEAYIRTLKWALDHKAAVFAIAIVLFLGSAALVPVVGTGFMPQSKERYVSIDVDYPEGTKVGTTNALARRIERVLEEDPRVGTYQTTVGDPGGAASNPIVGDLRGSNEAQLFLRLGDDVNVRETVERYREELAGLAPAGIIKVADAGSRTQGGGANVLELYVKGEDIADVRRSARALTTAITENVQGVGDVSNNLAKSKPEILVKVDQQDAAEEGLSAGQVAGYMRQLLDDEAVGTMVVDKDKLDIRFGLKLDPVKKLDDLRELELVNPMGDKVALHRIADVREVKGPVSIYTRNGTQYALIEAEITDRNVGAVSAQVKEQVTKADLPEGVTTSIGGAAEMMNESFAQLGMAMLVAVFAVWLVMTLAFGEATAPLAIMFSLPLATIGAMLGLLVVRQPVNMPAMIGILMLIGLVVTNAIVLVDRVQARRREGMPVREALLEAGQVRMRPILMTALTTIIALTPLAMGMSEGSLLSQSLAAAVMGGMTTSTLLTLVVVPCAYEALEGFFHANGERKRRRRGRREDARRRGARRDPEADEALEQRPDGGPQQGSDA